MVLYVDTGKKEPMRFSNGKITVEGSSGITHLGTIDLRNGIDSALKNESEPTRNSAVVSSSVSSQINKDNESVRKQINKEENKLIDKSNSKKLKSGQKLGLNDLISTSKLVIGLKYGFKSSSFDVDTSLFLMDSNGKTFEENFIYYNNLKSNDGSVKLNEDFGKNFTKYYNELISIDLSKVDSNIDKIAITSTIDEEGKNFSMLMDSTIYAIDPSSDKEIVNFNYDENLSNETAIVIIEIYKHNGNWKLQSIGKGFNGGLEALCNNYGVDTK
ncbi:TerD family protein [Helicovermis profundi]|uniref:TerD domain-containing protein n=1 Tax=Helicovermis profundi TaxID=3065157 RepID=A0AAU9EHC6_9FIRM|nr:hypothetical protein HLPR_12240 [Clostridia bacterium S502]